jgi:hypothetical protein
MSARLRKTNDVGLSPENGPATESFAIQPRVDAMPWTKVHADLDAQGWTVVPNLLTTPEADLVASLYHEEQGFRSHVIMARHGFGRGEYKYFSYPLPPLIQALRVATYHHLAPIAGMSLAQLKVRDGGTTSRLRCLRVNVNGSLIRYAGVLR